MPVFPFFTCNQFNQLYFMEDTLEKLRTLTKELPTIPKLGDFMGEDRSSVLKYEIPDGICISYALFSSPEISVARTFVTSGSKFPEHQHEETEYALIFSGSAMVSINNKEERLLKVGEVIVIEPNVPHVSRALEDTWFIAITIPYSKDYPHYGKKRRL